MRIKILTISVLISLTACNTELIPPGDGRINDYKSLIEEFADPGIEYRPAPLWVWNNDVEREDIDLSLAELKKQGVGGVFIHPRIGLITEYLSDEWFELVEYSMGKAKEIGLKVWIYDENVCPSGFAGGHVYNDMPESYNRGTILETRKMKKLVLDSLESKKIEFVFMKDGDKWINITDNSKKEEGNTGEYAVVYLFNFSTGSRSFAGFSYVDLIARGVTEKFMELTMEGYERVGRHEFGKLIPGIFTDEPHIGAEEGLRYTPDLFDTFKLRWGYSLEDEFMSLTEETGRWKKVRHDYRTVLLEMFIDRWSKPWYEYTEKNNLIWTGHYWENTWPDIYHGPDNMAMYAWHQMPGIDMLFNSLEERPDQFGNNMAVKELSSIANQFERHRTICETYGGAGWDLRFEDMKRLGDWEYALGVNFLNQHISQLSLVGCRKQNYPQSFLGYDPYWHLYSNQTDYFARLSVALSSGRQINNTLILEPTTSVWMYYDGQKSEELEHIGKSFKDLINRLEENQLEYDLGCENVIKHHGRVRGKNFIVNKRSYDLVVIPELMENIDRATFELLKQYTENGGVVLQLGDRPELLDGEQSGELDSLFKKDSWIESSLDEEVLKEYFLCEDFMMTPSPSGRIHHNRRQLADGEVLFIANFSLEEEANTIIHIKGASIEQLNAANGELSPVYYEKEGDQLILRVHLYPGESYMVFVHDRKVVPPDDRAAVEEKKPVSSTETEINVLQPNVLTIDYLDLQIMGEPRGMMYYAYASDTIYRRFGYLNGSPWNSVQYKTTFIDMNKMHKDGDRFTISYYFNLNKGTDKEGMKLVAEQAYQYNITVNGNMVNEGNETWLDPDFNVIDIEDFVNTGKNEVKLSMDHFDNRCDPSPVYILGNFALKPVEKGWDIVPATGIGFGSWRKQGYPFYSESVKYSKILETDRTGEYEVQLPEWFGTVSEIMVNGESTGIIQSQPYTKRITLEEGKNEISVIVYASLKNAFGPHHVFARGYMRPPAFRKGKDKMPAGLEYDFLDYGLMDDFRIYMLQ
ncbi:MAG: hypothetical protein JW965_01645 [Bacteroidales bacterium]|nr:hypothetical protein [Bacteroidales bacterium]